MYCKNCGKEIADGTKFCPFCGAAQAAEEVHAQENPAEQKPAGNGNQMDSHTTAVVGYITIIGFLVSICAGTRDDFSNYHLNQSLVLFLFSLLGVIPFVGWIWDIFVLVLWILGLINACNNECKPLPIVSYIHLIDEKK